jgi:5-methylthioadenosine/S-adenosylhomocysteine deaminase
VHISPTDLAGLASHGVSAALCRRSNARLLTGCPAVEKFAAIGLFFGLGTDSLASCQDLSPLAEAAAWWQQGQEAGIDANEALSWVTSGAARAVHQSDIGLLKPGMRADIAVFPGPQSQPQRSSAAARYKTGQPAAYLLDDLPPALHLLVNGEFVIREGKVLSDS